MWQIVSPAQSKAPLRLGDIGGEARVHDASFLGPHTVYKLRLNEHGNVTVTKSGQEYRHPIGATVRVSWSISSAWAVPMKSSKK